MVSASPISERPATCVHIRWCSFGLQLSKSVRAFVLTFGEIHNCTISGGNVLTRFSTDVIGWIFTDIQSLYQDVNIQYIENHPYRFFKKNIFLSVWCQVVIFFSWTGDQSFPGNSLRRFLVRQVAGFGASLSFRSLSPWLLLPLSHSISLYHGVWTQCSCDSEIASI